MLLAESFLERNGTLFQILAGFVFMLGAAGLTWYLGQRKKESKTFDYRVVSDLPILSHRPDDNELKVTYLDEELHNPRVLQVKFGNTGTEVIRASEVLEEYVLEVHDARLVVAEMVYSSATNLARFEAVIAEDGQHGVRLHLGTLNPGNNFTLQMIVDSEEPPKVTLSGRMEGQTRGPAMLLTYEERMAPRWLFSSGALVSGLFALLGIASLIYVHSGHPTGRQAIYAYVFASAPLMIAILMFTFACALAWRGHRERNPRPRE